MPVEHELSSRLRIGGKWYNRGEKVMLDERDAAIYKSRGISKPTVKVEQKEQTSIPASQVGIITKETDEGEKAPEETTEVKTENTGHGKSRGKGR